VCLHERIRNRSGVDAYAFPVGRLSLIVWSQHSIRLGDPWASTIAANEKNAST